MNLDDYISASKELQSFRREALAWRKKHNLLTDYEKIVIGLAEGNMVMKRRQIGTRFIYSANLDAMFYQLFKTMP